MEKEKILQTIKPFFPNAFLHPREEEIILVEKINLYFRTDNIMNTHELDCKMIEWCSRPAHKGVNNYWQNYVLRGLNGYFKKTWSKKEMDIIYCKLGNNCNRKLCSKFIDHDFDMSLLTPNKAG